ncbi:MAG: ATP-binding protein [Nitrospira sp.]|nr:ATP-binding protein [Nitrospira sp.]
MKRGSPIIWISFGLVSLTLSLMMVGNVLLKVAPDQSEDALWYRRSLAEVLAVQYSKLAERTEIETMQITMQALVERNDQIRSVALRRADGQVLSQAGEHQKEWVRRPGDESTFDQVQVPIMNGESRWGTLEVAFRPLSESLAGGIVQDPWIQFLALMAVCGYLGYLTFMKRTLRQLDPSSVVPDRVRNALDVLPVGVVLVDPQDRIVLANKMFGDRVGAGPDALMGHDLCEFPWEAGRSNAVEPELPWIMARKHKRAAPALPLELRKGDGEVRRFVVTSSPILDDREALRGVMVSFHDVTELDQANSQLRDANTELEASRAQIMHKNEELETTNANLHSEINERKKAQAEREELHQQLMQASRRAGMADVASSVLHNVGNVLNSINVSTDTLLKTLKKPMVGDVCRIASLFHEHQNNLQTFLTQDPKGKQIPSYLGLVAESLSGSHQTIQAELDSLVKKVDHIKHVVLSQQDIAHSGSIRETAVVEELMEQALMMGMPEPEKYGIRVVREYAKAPTIVTDRHQVLQILVNMITNAKNAMVEYPANSHCLTVRIQLPADRRGLVRLEVSDTGSGIKAEHISRLFAQGFTTRNAGHGLGLHSAAISAKNLGGAILAQSAGEGRGATFTLDLPLTVAEAAA